MIAKNKGILLFSLLLLITLIAAYSNHFNNGFHFDDSHTIEDNVHIRNISNIPDFFSDPKMFSSDPDHWGLRPLVTTTLAVDYWLGDSLKPFYFHLSTFIWYIALCVLLFFVYKKLLKSSFTDPWVGYFALFMVAWYALHTANAETINYVISRSDVLSTFFIVVSFLMYIGLPGLRKWYLYLIPAVIGVFAKETVLVLVIVLFFYIILFEKRLSLYDVFKVKNFKSVGNAVLVLLPLLIAVVCFQVYTLSKVSSIPGISNSPVYYILTQSYVWLRYFIAFFLPMNLSADTDWTVINNVFDERIIVGLAFVTVLFITIFKTSVKPETRPISFGLIWFAAALLPTSLAPFAEVTNDHRMFFPFIGLVLSVVTSVGLWLIRSAGEKAWGMKYKVGSVVVVLMVLGLNAFGVYQRNKIWKDEASLWLDVTVKSPLNGRGMMNYGLTQMAIGNYAAAELHFNKALVYLPNYHTLYINNGVLKNAMNQPVVAEENFKKAILLSPNSFDVYAFYARFLMQNNRREEARSMAEKAYQINPYSVMTLNILMSVYNGFGLWDDLVKIAKHTLSIAPNDPVALTYLDAGTKKNVLAENAPKAIVGRDAASYLDESLAHYNRQAYVECIESCKKALELKPDYADAYSNMGAAYNQLKEWEKGVEACKKALKINPAHKLAAGNLAWATNELSK